MGSRGQMCSTLWRTPSSECDKQNCTTCSGTLQHVLKTKISVQPEQSQENSPALVRDAANLLACLVSTIVKGASCGFEPAIPSVPMLAWIDFASWHTSRPCSTACRLAALLAISSTVACRLAALLAVSSASCLVSLLLAVCSLTKARSRLTNLQTVRPKMPQTARPRMFS